MPEISVLLPARNAATTIVGAVRSTLADLPRDAELVVLDDGSSDGTALQLEQVSDPRLRLLTRERSTGLSSALNYLLDKTDSRLVARMDADDITLRGRFRSSRRAMVDGIDMVFTSALGFKGRRLRPAVPLPISFSAFPYHLLLSNPVRHDALLARRSAISQLGGYREVPSEDYDLWLRSALSGDRLVVTSWYGVACRDHPNQVTASPDWRQRSQSNPQMAEVFSELSASLLGRPFPRLVTLGAESEATLEEFSAVFRESIRGFPLAQRLALLRKLSVRRAQVRRSWA